MSNIAKLTLTITNCTQCPNHEQVSDSDPLDSFCSDDQAVLCKLKKPLKGCGRRFPYRAVTVACRPYMVQKESAVPDWCPLIEKKKQ